MSQGLVRLADNQIQRFSVQVLPKTNFSIMLTLPVKSTGN